MTVAAVMDRASCATTEQYGEAFERRMSSGTPAAGARRLRTSASALSIRYNPHANDIDFRIE